VEGPRDELAGVNRVAEVATSGNLRRATGLEGDRSAPVGMQVGPASVTQIRRSHGVNRSGSRSFGSWRQAAVKLSWVMSWASLTPTIPAARRYS
jgi:hypothetical protein